MTTTSSPPGARQRKSVGHLRRRRGGVDAEVQEADAGLGEQRHDAERVAGHVGHLRRDGRDAEAAVELLRRRRGRRGRAPGDISSEWVVKGRRVPADQAALDGALQPRHLGAPGGVSR